jgi:hypothetical protein
MEIGNATDARLPLIFRAIPAFLSGVLGDLFTLIWGKGIGPSTTTLKATFAPEGDGSRVFGRIRRGVIRFHVLDLAGEYVAYQLAELYGIAGAGKAL